MAVLVKKCKSIEFPMWEFTQTCILLQWSTSSSHGLNEFPLTSFSTAQPLAGFPSTRKTYIVQLANLHRLCSSFMRARHVSCCEQPIQRELFELVYCCSRSGLHCPISSFLARQHTPAACYRGRRRDDEALCPAGVPDISDVQISWPTTNYRTFPVTTERFLLTSCAYMILSGSPL